MVEPNSGIVMKGWIKMMNEEDKRSLPLGLGMALAQNTEAMNHFASLSKQEQQRIIDHTKTVSSKSEMQQFVQQLGENPSAFF